MIDTAIEKAKNIPRDKALERTEKKKNYRVIFVLDFNHCLPSMSGIIQSAWRVMVQDPYMKKVFPKPPMIALRRPKNLKDQLVKSKVPDPPPLCPIRQVFGMKRCKKPNCPTCPFVIVGKEVKCEITGIKFKINYYSDCDTINLIYCILCTKCRQNYIGETSRSLDARFREHLGYVRNKKLKEPTGFHFNLPGNDISMMQITILEKVWSSSTALRRTRESHYIQEFQSKYQGMNRKF